MDRSATAQKPVGSPGCMMQMYVGGERSGRSGTCSRLEANHYSRFGFASLPPRCIARKPRSLLGFSLFLCCSCLHLSVREYSVKLTGCIESHCLLSASHAARLSKDDRRIKHRTRCRRKSILDCSDYNGQTDIRYPGNTK